ncbi:MAG TPA: S-methyl-5-thioribose-1-phosphate isomerase [bacterium]|nr:S-methyl-5-thioribose-1-phosphate isomerase [bacterium]
MAVRTIEWRKDCVRIIDQTRLPEESVYRELHTVEEMAEAIETLRVRGAPAIGIAAAMGVALAARLHRKSPPELFNRAVDDAMERLKKTRPTAVNLFGALERMRGCLHGVSMKPGEAADTLLREALAIYEEDEIVCRRMGENGAELLGPDSIVLTHCNAGGLATAGYGTALGVIYAAHEAGRIRHVYADETRPLLQGSRLTAWELSRSGIPVTVICDSAAASVMHGRRVDAVLVGADRIAANGDTANKIGTYSLAVLARYHGIPFYVVAPVSTVDMRLSSGESIPIEERSADEVIQGFGRLTAPNGAGVLNPAFDVTPHTLISAIVTEAGVLRPPFEENLYRLMGGNRPPETFE